MTTEEQYLQIRERLAGKHDDEVYLLDQLWNEMNQLRAKGPTNQETRQTVQEFQDQAREASEQTESTETKEPTS